MTKYIVILPSTDEHEDPETFLAVLLFSNDVNDDGQLLYVTNELVCPFCCVEFQTVEDFGKHLEAFRLNREQHMKNVEKAHKEAETHNRFL